MISGYLPPGLKLQKVSLLGSKTKKITIQYINDTKILAISATGNIENGGTTLAYDEDDTTVKEIDINGRKGILLVNETGMCTLKWYDQGISYLITGTYPQEKLINIAKSFSYKEPE